MSRFQPNDKLYRTEQMISTELDEETVLMSIEAGAYYGLEATAQSIWRALETPQTFATLVERLTSEYEISAEACAADLEPFLVALEQEGLLRVE